jgi:hypothetical protein
LRFPVVLFPSERLIDADAVGETVMAGGRVILLESFDPLMSLFLGMDRFGEAQEFASLFPIQAIRTSL